MKNRKISKENHLYIGLIVLLIIVLLYVVYYQNNNENFVDKSLDSSIRFDIDKFIRINIIDLNNLLSTPIKEQQNEIKEFRDKIDESKFNTQKSKTDEFISIYEKCMKNPINCKIEYSNLPKVLNPLINIFKNLENKECITPDEKNIIIKNHIDKIKQFLDSNDSTSSNFSINDLIQDTATNLSTFYINKFIKSTIIDQGNILNIPIEKQQTQIKEFRDKIDLSKIPDKRITQTDVFISIYSKCMNNPTNCKIKYSNLPEVLNPLRNIFKNLENKKCITYDDKNIIIKNHTDKIRQFLDSNDSTSSNFSINDLIQDTETKLSAIVSETLFF